MVKTYGRKVVALGSGALAGFVTQLVLGTAWNGAPTGRASSAGRTGGPPGLRVRPGPRRLEWAPRGQTVADFVRQPGARRRRSTSRHPTLVPRRTWAGAKLT